MCVLYGRCSVLVEFFYVGAARELALLGEARALDGKLQALVDS